ncbi:hypothetical protein [Actinoplanes sp. URMC 104]|uniref:hypothetical protein n=1 Tax=Actinoplanes sp. URMC 104 TaxID=3423409 RepID=UPI003F1E3850
MALFAPSLMFFIAATLSVAVRGPVPVQISLALATAFWPALFVMAGVVADVIHFASWFIRRPSGDGNWSTSTAPSMPTGRSSCITSTTPPTW